MHPPRSDPFGELQRLGRGVVHAAKEAVLDCHRPPGARLVPIGGRKDVIDAKSASHGKQPGPGLVFGRMEGDRKVDLQAGFRQSVDPGDDPHG